MSIQVCDQQLLKSQSERILFSLQCLVKLFSDWLLPSYEVCENLIYLTGRGDDCRSFEGPLEPPATSIQEMCGNFRGVAGQFCQTLFFAGSQGSKNCTIRHPSRLLRDDFAVLPNVYRRPVHARGLARDLCSAAQRASDGCREFFAVSRTGLTLHGERSSNRGV